MTVLLIATIAATSIIVAALYEPLITKLNDDIDKLLLENRELKQEVADTQEICDLGWTDCLCRPGVTDPNCAFLRQQADGLKPLRP